MKHWINLAAAVVGTWGTMGVLLAMARRRGRQLAAQASESGATWAALCRVIREGTFLDGGKSRQYGGPRGVLTVKAGQLHYRPDEYKPGEPYRPCDWPTTDVRCVRSWMGRDISGIRMRKLELEVPQGRVRFAVFCEYGALPDFLT